MIALATDVPAVGVVAIAAVDHETAPVGERPHDAEAEIGHEARLLGDVEARTADLVYKGFPSNQAKTGPDASRERCVNDLSENH